MSLIQSLITVLVAILIPCTAQAATDSWETYARNLHIKEHSIGTYESWPISEKQTLVSDLIEMGYIEPTEESQKLLESSLSEDKQHAIADAIMIGCVNHLATVQNDPSLQWVNWWMLTKAFMGDSFAWTPTQKACYQEITNLYRSSVEKDVYVVPNEQDLPEEEAIAIAKEALIRAYAPERLHIDPCDISTTLYVTDHHTHSSPDYRRWCIEFASVEPYAHVIVDSKGLVIQDFEMAYWSVQDYALAKKTTVDEQTPLLIQQYVQMAGEEGCYQLWQWSVEGKAAYSRQVAIAKGDENAFINPTQSDEPIKALLYGATFTYGAPTLEQLQEESAVVLAKQYVKDFYHLSEVDLAEFLYFASFDVTDSQNPLWKLIFCPYAFEKEEDDRLYKVELHAETGEITGWHRLYWDSLFQDAETELLLY